jgi:hypothetical protein
VFPKDVPASWLLATYYALMHAAAGEVNAVREPFLKSYRTPPTRGEQASRPSREALSPDGRARGDEQGGGSAVSRDVLLPLRAHRLPDPPRRREWRGAGDASTPGRPDKTPFRDSFRAGVVGRPLSRQPPKPIGVQANHRFRAFGPRIPVGVPPDIALRDDLGAECAISYREPPAGSAHQVRASTGAAHDTKRSGGCTSCRIYDVLTMSASPSRTLTR